MKRIADWSVALAALLAAFAAVTIKITDLQHPHVHESAVTSRADWFAAARARDGTPTKTRTGVEESEDLTDEAVEPH
jgi:hypothetical protein